MELNNTKQGSAAMDSLQTAIASVWRWLCRVQVALASTAPVCLMLRCKASLIDLDDSGTRLRGSEVGGQSMPM